jgi:uncharacterized XkdX family phage protein
MNWYEKIKYYYELGLWNITMVRNAVLKEKITPEQYKEIIGFDYQA